MREDCSEIPPWTAENLDHEDLLLMWKSIMHALISTGHVAELHRELNYASQTGRYYRRFTKRDITAFPIIPHIKNLRGSESPLLNVQREYTSLSRDSDYLLESCRFPKNITITAQ
jgi:hypothetical protein